MKSFAKFLIIQIVLLGLFQFGNAQGVNQKKSANMGNRHVKSSAKGGMPDNAVGYASEGNLAAFSNRDSLFIEPLDSKLQDLGISGDDWKKIESRLRDSWAAIGNDALKKTISQLNEDYFFKIDCIAVYAEYGGKGGQKAMTVYTLKVWNTFPD